MKQTRFTYGWGSVIFFYIGKKFVRCGRRTHLQVVPVAINYSAVIWVHIIGLHLLLELKIDPKHAKVEQKDCRCEDAILVVGQVDWCFDEEKQEDDDARYDHLAVEEDILLRIGHIGIFVTKTPWVFCVVLQIWCVTNSSRGDHEREVEVVGDPSVYRRESHMNRDEVDEAHYISAIVFVLERLVDEILHDDLEQDVGDDRCEQKVQVLQLVDEDEAGDCTGHGHAQDHEAEAYFEQ